MNYKKINFNEMNKTEADTTFPKLLDKKNDKVLRDSFILISPENSETEKLTAGFTAVYPGCSTGGHSHREYEEIYFITKGKGIAQIGEEKFDIVAGDCFHIPYGGSFHRVFNPNNENLEYYWVLNSK